MDLPTEIIPHIHRPATPKDFEKVYDLYMDRSSNPYLTYDQMDKPEFEKIYNEILPSNTLFVVELMTRSSHLTDLFPKKPGKHIRSTSEDLLLTGRCRVEE